MSARGQLQGSLDDVKTTVALDLLRPGAGPLRLPERWQGQLTGSTGSAFNLRLASQAPAMNGSLTVRLGSSGWPLQADLRRGGGSLTVRPGAKHQVQWNADQLPIAGLQLTLPSGSASGSLQGRRVATASGSATGGAGWCCAAGGSAAPRSWSESDRVEGRVSGGARARGRLQPQQGEVQLTAEGRVGADLRSRIEAWTDVPGLVQMANSFVAASSPPGAPGRAEDLGRTIDTFGGSLEVICARFSGLVSGLRPTSVIIPKRALIQMTCAVASMLSSTFQARIWHRSRWRRRPGLICGCRVIIRTGCFSWTPWWLS